MADKIAHALYLKRPGQQNPQQHFILQAAAGARLFVSDRIRSGGSEGEWRAEKAVAVVLEARATIATTKRVLIEGVAMAKEDSTVRMKGFSLTRVNNKKRQHYRS